MQQVLLDSSTVVFVNQLIKGKVRPSAINVFDLAVLVESIILHETITVLNTTEQGSHSAEQLRDAAATWGGFITFEARSPKQLLDDYLAKHWSEDLSSGKPIQYWDGKRAGSFVDVIRHLDRDLLEQYYGDEEIARYQQILTEIYLGYQHGGLMRTALKLVGVNPDPNSLDLFKGGFSIHSDYQRLYEKTNLPGQSPWEFHMTMAGMSYQDFAKGIILRAHLYLIASEVFAAPYKADSLRWPICWKFFNAGSLGDLCEEERYVRAAEEFESRRINSANDFFGQRVFLARLPLFLRWIMKQSMKPSDIVNVALQIRQSKEARRFREYASQVNLDIEDGKIREVLSGIAQYSKLLSQEYGIDKSEVAWTLLSKGTEAATTGLSPSGAIDIAKEGSKVGGGLIEMWRNRKFALISKAIKQGREARSFEHDLRRLFGSGLSEKDLDLLEQLNSFGDAEMSKSEPLGKSV